MKTVNIYTDGACSGNQNEENIGGWGAILVYGAAEKELWGGELNTTNNRMELKALIAAVSALKEKGLFLNIYSDSSYLIGCMKEGWYKGWQKNGWKNSKRQPVENRDLWQQLLALLSDYSARFFLVKGHLNINSEKTMKDAYEQFLGHNGETAYADFLHIAEMNNRADALANRFKEECGK